MQVQSCCFANLKFTRHFHISHNVPYLPQFPPPPPSSKFCRTLFFISPGYYSRPKKKIGGGGGANKTNMGNVEVAYCFFAVPVPVAVAVIVA